MSYPILDIPLESPLGDEPMGTKEKFWLIHIDGRHGLFKATRVNDGISTGEDWAEKIASELAHLIGIPAAKVELANWNNRRGIVSFDVRQPLGLTAGEGLDETNEPIGALVHGNELLGQIVGPTYPEEGTQRTSEHTVRRILKLLQNDFFLIPSQEFDSESAIETTADVFVGYLLLDALISNTDRHHENWGIISTGHWTAPFLLSPSYDHASSLGRELHENAQVERLATKDRNRTVERYVAGAKSALYRDVDDRRPLSPIDAFREAARFRPPAAEFWCSKLGKINQASWRAVIDNIPRIIMSDPAKEFADRMLEVTYAQLLSGGTDSA